MGVRVIGGPAPSALGLALEVRVPELYNPSSLSEASDLSPCRFPGHGGRHSSGGGWPHLFSARDADHLVSHSLGTSRFASGGGCHDTLAEKAEMCSLAVLKARSPKSVLQAQVRVLAGLCSFRRLLGTVPPVPPASVSCLCPLACGGLCSFVLSPAFFL